MDDKPLFVSVPEAARRLSISRSLLYREIDEGRFPAKRIGGRIVVSVKVIEQMAEPSHNGGNLK